MFQSPTIGKLSRSQLTDEITKFIKSDLDANYRLIIGSDSHQRGSNGKSYLKLVSAIVVHKIGAGGRYFWNSKIVPQPKSLRDKIYTETLLSLEVARKVLPNINASLNGNKNYDLEIHIDVGRSGDTRDMIKEVVGMVVGSGFTAKTKPESYGASKVADKHT